MKNDFSRRKFIGLSAAAAGATIAAKTILLDPDPLFAAPRQVAPSDRLRFGIIGIGMQGSGLARAMPSNFPASSASPPAISTTAATFSPARSPTRPICPSPAAIRICSPTRISIASSPPFPTTGTSRSSSTPSPPARTSTARSRCRTPPPKAPKWPMRRRNTDRIVQIGSQRVSSHDLQESQGDGRAGHARRPHDDRRLARPQRSHRRLGISTALRSLPAKPRLGHLARHGAQARLQPGNLRALALLEGIRHRCRRRSARAPRQRHDVRAGLERAAEDEPWPSAASCAGKTAATCPTSTAASISTATSPSTCASTSEPKCPRPIASRAQKAFSR